MPTVPRFVFCPKCRSLLQEPPPGNPVYQCGTCSTILQAKHATQQDLQALRNRSSGEQLRRNSYSDSSSGEIGTDAVADDPLTENGDDAPLHEKEMSATETVPESGSRGRNVTKPEGVHLQDSATADPYPQAIQNQEEDFKRRVADVVSSAETAQEEIGSRDHWPSSQDASDETLIVHVQETDEVCSRTDVTTPAEFEAMSSGGQSYGTETLTSESRTNGNLLPRELQQFQESHVQRANPDFALESLPDTGHTHHRDLGRLRIYEPSVDHVARSQPPVVSVASGTTRKLQWKVRESDSGDEATSSGAASSKGISEDEYGGSQDDAKSSSVSITTGVGYKAGRDWKTVRSRRSSISEDRRSLDEQQSAGAEQQQLVRGASDDSDRAIDMYENSAHVLDYEPSDTSSTTMDDAESNGGGDGISGRFSGEMDRLPPAVFDQGSLRPVPRPHLPRSTTNSSRGSVRSEESSSYGSPSQLEMVSPTNHLDNARISIAARRHSWDERTLSRMGTAAPGYPGPQAGLSSVRVKSSSQDFGGGQADYLPRVSSVSSDPGGRLLPNRGRQLPGSSLYDNFRQPSPYALRSPQQQQWANRPSQSIQQHWSPSSSYRPSSSYFPEPSPLHPSNSRLSPSMRQLPGGQLPPKQGHYPPLPPPGALPHVLCQHCGLVLAVPDNLRPNEKNTQKLRCGSCWKISIFSVPQAEGSIAVQVFGSSRSDTLPSPTLLVSSPDSQEDFHSSYRPVSDSLGAGERQRSVRRYSVSDLAEKQVQATLVRKHSLGNEDLNASDQEEMVERALSERAEALSINSAASSPSFSVPNSGFRNPSADDKSSQSGEIPLLPNDSPYQKAGGVPYPRFNNIPQSVNAGNRVSAEEKLSSEVSLSDSESDPVLRSPSATNALQLNQSNARSSPPLSVYNALPDPRSSGRGPEDAPSEQMNHEARGLTKTLNRIFIFRKGKQGGAAHYRRKVVVNGVPIPDHLVKKAEEQAGPIHPGTYWYDGQAGFWGGAGGLCLGIIPPFIEEFNYPMTRDCAAGRTGIFVNGRELHHLDREKLCRRGLPDTPGMSYHVEIDGRVVEEATGSELRSLGRLAPSLEKSGRGAGMHVPSNISGGRR